MAAAEGHEKIVRFLTGQEAVIGVRDIEGKTALNRATVNGSTAIIQVLKDRAEGKKLVFSNPHIELNTNSGVSNVEYLHLMNVGACAGTERDRCRNWWKLRQL
jgi:ankyrin repeat protein